MVLRDNFTGGTPTRLYALQDGNYDTVALVDASGSVLERYTYTPYGTVTVRDASDNPVAGNQSAYGWQYLFQGGRLDSETGWYGFEFRDYAPAEGRWAERDPLGLAAGDMNIYRFAAGDPESFVDPTGLAPGDWLDQGFGGGRYGPPGWSGWLIARAGDVASFAPIAGEIGDAGQLILGTDFNGNDLSTFDQGAILVGTMLPLVPGSLVQKIGKRIVKPLGRNADDVVEAAAKASRPLSRRTDQASRACQMAPATSGGRWRWGYGAIKEAEAEAAYQAIRESTTDVAAISRYTGYRAERIQRIKDYLFRNPEWTATDELIAAAWHRLRTGRGTEVDRLLLKHETAEMWVRRVKGADYWEAHRRANQRWNWQKAVEGGCH